MIQGVLNHSHRDRTGNSVLVDRILETLEVSIDRDLSSNVPSVGIRISFFDVVSTVTIMDISRVIDQI